MLLESPLSCLASGDGRIRRCLEAACTGPRPVPFCRFIISSRSQGKAEERRGANEGETEEFASVVTYLQLVDPRMRQIDSRLGPYSLRLGRNSVFQLFEPHFSLDQCQLLLQARLDHFVVIKDNDRLLIDPKKKTLVPRAAEPDPLFFFGGCFSLVFFCLLLFFSFRPLHSRSLSVCLSLFSWFFSFRLNFCPSCHRRCVVSENPCKVGRS